jgi:hypothetical protein
VRDPSVLAQAQLSHSALTAGFWHPQVQAAPAQFSQPQLLFFCSFMTSLLMG